MLRRPVVVKSTIAVLLALLLALTACGSKEQPNDAGSDKKGDPVKLAQCMREHGINMPDPKDGEKGGMVIEAAPGDSENGALDMDKMNAAHEDCKQYMENGGEYKPPSPEQHVLAGQISRKVEAALEKLPDKQRTAFILKNNQGLSIKEIAEMMQTAEGTVKVHLHRAVTALRQSLAEFA